MEDRFESFISITSEIHKCINKIKTEEMASLNLKNAHALYVYYLYKHKKLSLTQLSAKCRTDKSAVSRAIDYLKSEGYIEISDSGYKKPIKLTEKGNVVGAELNKKINSILEATSDGVSDEDRAIMYQTLEKILKSLSAVCSSYDEK